MSSHTIVIYTDGSALSNPGPGGWGYLIWNKKDNTINEGGGYQDHATNNQMELSALLDVFKYINKLKEKSEIVIHLDSDYVRNGITKWIINWKKNGWETANKKPVLNKELWMKIDKKFQKIKKNHKLELIRVDGHSGNAGNDIVDEIAKEYALNKKYKCFKGSIDNFEKLKGIKI